MQRYLKISVFSALFFLLMQHSALAELSLRIHGCDVARFPAITLLLNVEKDGAAVDAPPLSHFAAAMEDGQRVRVKQVRSLEDSGENVAMLLAVDTSGSMKKDQLSAIKEAIEKLIDQKSKEDLIGLTSFNDDVFENCPFTRDKGVFLEKLKVLRPAGKSTVLFKAVYTGLELLEKQALPRLRYLVVLSDGKDEGVGFNLEDAISKAQKLHIPVYALGFAGKADAKYLDNMERLAKMTGGEYRKVRGSSEFIDAYASMAGNIFKQQVLDLAADFKGDGLKHHLEIQYSSPEGEVGKAAVDFLAPLFKEVAMAPSSKEKKSEPLKTRFIKALSNTAVFGSIGIFVLLLIIASAILGLRRKKRAKADREKMLKPKIPEDKAITTSPETTQTPTQPKVPPIANPLALKISGTDREIGLKPQPMTIGAYPDCSIILSEDTVSGYHAEISGNGEQWVLRDLGSTNGTRLNDQYIKKTEPIKIGDRIQIGPVAMIIKSGKGILK